MASTRTRASTTVALALVALTGGALTASGACVRHADIYDEPDGGSIMTTPQFDAGKVMPIDAGLRDDGGLPCEGRPYAVECKGPADFPCDFEGFVLLTATQCQAATGCQTNGILEVKLATDGCVAEVGMSQPNAAMVDCLVDIYQAVRCPCGASELSISLGHENDGCDGG